MEVEVIYATPDKQVCIPVCLQKTSSLQEVIVKSGIADQFSEIDLSALKVGIFGKVSSLDKPVMQGDRIEIYRPLLTDPMDARRKRAFKSR